MDYPIQWDIIVEILELLLFLMHNDGWHEAFTTISGKDK